MPEFSGAWPPEPWDVAQSAYDLHSAWVAGDTDVLAAFYAQNPDGKPAKTRSAQYSTGVIGKVARWFWGRPPQQATKRLHIPAAADVARTSADLLFGQPPQWVLNQGDATNLEAAQDRLNQLLECDDATATFLEAAELQAALGGVFLRLFWDSEVTDKVMLSAVGPDAAIPEWRYGKLAAVTFWSIVATDKRGTWRHLERHEPGAIEHALYCGDSDHIGRRLPLQEQDATAWAAELVDQNSSIPTGVKGLTAAYIPNVRPARRWRNVPGLSPLGRSDFEGIEHLFDALDEAWSSWMRDLDLAKARLFVASSLLEQDGPGQGASWDPEQAIYTPAPADDMIEGGPNSLVQAQQFAIRHAEHQATCTALMNRILVSAGYSTGDFGDDQLAGQMTATEVTARKDLSNRTRSKKALYWGSAMAPLARTMLDLDELVYGGSYGLQADPEMQFPVRVDQDPVQRSVEIANLRTAQAISIAASVRKINPNMSSDEVDEEVAAIKAELAELAPDPEPFGDSDFDTTPEPHSDLQPDSPLPEDGDELDKAA
ncbi:phage portal protein [Nocardia sp. NPDC058640]|uniref:phage portal protein n=1 Tax=Nocardia sp. NPDC058640 TaxID=3346571 RepID=UPI00364F00C9